MFAGDDITTTVVIHPEDIRKWAKLPKQFSFNANVEVKTNRDGEVICYKIKATTWKYRKVKVTK